MAMLAGSTCILIPLAVWGRYFAWLMWEYAIWILIVSVAR